MKSLEDSDEFGREVVVLLKDQPKSLSVHRVINPSEIDETQVKGSAKLACLLHQSA